MQTIIIFLCFLTNFNFQVNLQVIWCFYPYFQVQVPQKSQHFPVHYSLGQKVMPNQVQYESNLPQQIFEQTAKPVWEPTTPIFIQPSVPNHSSDNSPQFRDDSYLTYIFNAPLICPQGHQIIRGSCRKVYEF